MFHAKALTGIAKQAKMCFNLQNILQKRNLLTCSSSVQTSEGKVHVLLTVKSNDFNLDGTLPGRQHLLVKMSQIFVQNNQTCVTVLFCFCLVLSSSCFILKVTDPFPLVSGNLPFLPCHVFDCSPWILMC